LNDVRVAELETLTVLFGAEPELLDPTSPWPYGGVTFKASRGGFEVVFEYHYSAQRIVISRGNHEVAYVALDGVSDLEVVTERGRELVILRPTNSNRSITLRLSPDVYLAVTG
jgi:hypothetical protein